MTAVAPPLPQTQIPWCMRADLRYVPLEFEGCPTWGVKDPVTLCYFELRDEAFFVLNQLDGKRTVEAICQAFHDRFRPRTLSLEELRSFVGQLVSQSLVVSQTPGYGRLLVAKVNSNRSRQRLSQFTSLLAIRFRGFDPDRLFGWMLPWISWLFTPWAVAAGLLMIASAVTLVLVQFDELIARLPDAQAFLSTPNLIWLSLLLAIVKVLHEFGHGLTCKRFGAECHELGVMLLVFTPTLYCNVSDIWMVKDKWRRIAVSLAGMWVEAVIAATCTVLWWFSSPGLFHSVCLNLMLICGVSTFVFNGNPLLRYDGYFVLADWLEIPNLQQQAAAIVRAKFFGWFCEMDSADELDASWQRNWGLFAYGLASSIYRIMLTFLILWGMNRWLTPLGLGVFVQLLAVLTMGTMILLPLYNGAMFLRSPSNLARIHGIRTVVTLGLLLLLFTIPLPCRVTAESIVDDDGAQRVYVTMPGTLTEGAKIGDHVDAGQVVARLEEPRLKATLTQLEGELNQQRLRLELLEKRRVSEPNVAQNIPTVREVVRDLEQQLAQRHRDAARLVLQAPCRGTVLPGPRQRGVTSLASLPGWTGSPLEEQNRGSFLGEGTTVCLVGNPYSRAALLVISQDDINLVRVGQRVRFRWNELSGEIVEGEIVELAALDFHELGREALIRMNLPLRSTANRSVRPVGTWYQARVKLDESDAPLLRSSSGTARILVDPQSLVSRLVRWMKQTFPI